ncbi:hypothetical protein [Paraburkholderia dilworthii]|uniref:Uncharacterized protein n=1 Tax=Paraburkholderia dilworthii TaxID=948106 RepID=A0ABW9DJ68_9BURK
MSFGRKKSKKNGVCFIVDVSLSRARQALGIRCICRRLFVVLASISVCACTMMSPPPDIETRDQAAGVLISSRAIRWQDIASNLQPGFQITGTTALTQVAPVTQEAQLATLNALGINISAGALVGPFRNPASGSYAETTPSSVPSPQAPSGIPLGATLPSAATPNTSFAIDPMLQYTAANALFQLVQLINADLTSSPFTHDYVAYVVRLKLTVVPYRENLPYDLFARISFFPDHICSTVATSKTTDSSSLTSAENGSKPEASNKAGAKGKSTEDTKPDSVSCVAQMPLVVPLLVTDDIQRAASSAAAESAKQLALALEILAPYAQGTASANSVKQQLQSLSGQNYDSILTVGRDNENTLLVRVGAAYQTVAASLTDKKKSAPQNTRSLVGQNYDVSTIVLVPRDYFTQRTDPNKFGLVVDEQSDFINTDTGKRLDIRPHDVTVQDFDSALKEADYEITGSPWYRQVWNDGAVDKYAIASKMNGYVTTGSFDNFLEEYCNWKLTSAASVANQSSSTQVNAESAHVDASKSDSGQKNVAMQMCRQNTDNQHNAEFIWTRLSALSPDSSFSSSSIDLPVGEKVVIPPQVPTVLDDGKASMTLQLRTQNASLSEKLIATLTLTGKRTKDVPGKKVKGVQKKVQEDVPFSIPIVSKSSSFDQTTGILTFQFPSAAASGITGVNAPDGGSLSLSQPGCDLESNYDGVHNCPRLFSTPSSASSEQPSISRGNEALSYDIKYVLAPNGPSLVPGFTFASGTKQIVESNGTGSVIVYFPTWGAEDTAVLTFDGASLTAASAGTLANGQVTLKTSGTAVTLQLMNLVPGVPVTAQAEGKLGGTSTGKISLVFNVVPMQMNQHTP